MNYDQGLEILKRQLQGDAYQDFLVFEARLRENLRREQRFGSSETLRSERAMTVGELNRLALANGGVSFNALCAGDGGAGPAPKPALDLPALRARLQRLDAVEIEALCLDHFPAVYDKFGRGLRRDEMLNLLLDHVRRNPADAPRLAALLDAPPAEGRSGGGPASDAVTTPLRPIRNRWALLVGIDAYIDPAFPTLKFCVRDVLALEAALKAVGYTVVTLYDDAPPHLLPTRDNVEAELARICQVAGEDDLVWAHFSGHGMLTGGKAVLITRETRAPTLARKALPLAEIEGQLRGSAARRLLLTLDACHTGLDRGRDIADPAFIRNAYELAEGFALLAASTSQQIAQEWDEKEHGVFTYYLLEGLHGKADRADKRFVTVNDLVTHTLDGLRRWNVEHGGLLQEPNARVEGMGDMILADFRPAHAAGAPQASATTGAGGGRGWPAPNPFGKTGRITDPTGFFDREALLRRIFEELGKGVNLSLVGESQVGKSSLLAQVCAAGPAALGLPAEAFAYLNLEWTYDENDFYLALADALHLPEPLRGYKLTRALGDRRHVLCLDEIEKMTWDGFTVHLRSQLRGLADGPAAPLKLVIASRSPLARLFPDSPELDSPLAGICLHLDVGPFSPEVAREFLAARLAGSGVAFTEDDIARLLAETGGHPARLQRAAAELYEARGRA